MRKVSLVVSFAVLAGAAGWEVLCTDFLWGWGEVLCTDFLWGWGEVLCTDFLWGKFLDGFDVATVTTRRGSRAGASRGWRA